MINEYLNLLHTQNNYYTVIILAAITLYSYYVTRIELNDMIKDISINIPCTAIDKIKGISTVIFINSIRLLSTIVTIGGLMSIYAIFAEIPKQKFLIYYIFNFIPTIALYLHNIISNTESVLKLFKSLNNKEGV